MTSPRLISLFAGIGGFDLGFERAGFRTVAYVERDPHCLKLLAAKWPEAVAVDDVCKACRHNLPDADVLTFGFPCQDLSVAGKRAGLVVGERSSLFMEALRIAHELHIPWILFENVPGLLSGKESEDADDDVGSRTGDGDEAEPGRDGDGGARGGPVPPTWMGILLSEVAKHGYDGAWRVLDAQWFGVAQRRRRVFGLFTRLDSGANRCAEILSIPESLRGHPAPRRETGKVAPAIAASGVGAGRTGNERTELDFCVEQEVAGCLSANAKVDRGDTSHNSHLVPQVCWCLTNGKHPGSYNGQDASSGRIITDVSKCLGACPTMTGHLDPSTETFIPISFKVRCGCEGGGKGFLGSTVNDQHVAVPMALSERTRNGGSVFEVERDPVMPALKTGTQRQQAVAVAFKPSHFTRGKDGAPSEVLPPLSADADKGDQESVVAFESRFARNGRGRPENIVPPLKAQSGQTSKGDSSPLLATAMCVRRLTPVECERLQGFPDNWTAGFRDSTRYKMLGNAVCVNVAEWIAKRLMERMS